MKNFLTMTKDRAVGTSEGLFARFCMVFPHQGLGDHIACNALYRELSLEAHLVFIFTKRLVFGEVRKMLSDSKKIIPIPLPNTKNVELLVALSALLQKMGFWVIGLGGFGASFSSRTKEIDYSFYVQAGLDPEIRWRGFRLPRRLSRESALFNMLNQNQHPYLLIHEDVNRHFLIDRTRITSKNFEFIYVRPIRGFTIFDWILLAEQAHEIHCIESSFSCLIASLNLGAKPKFAHRYARPEGNKGTIMQFRLSENWTILN